MKGILIRMRKYEVVEYEESDYEDFYKTVQEMSNKELSEMASRVIDGYFGGYFGYNYGSPDEEDFLDYKKARIISEAINRLKRM